MEQYGHRAIDHGQQRCAGQHISQTSLDKRFKRLRRIWHHTSLADSAKNHALATRRSTLTNIIQIAKMAAYIVRAHLTGSIHASSAAYLKGVLEFDAISEMMAFKRYLDALSIILDMHEAEMSASRERGIRIGTALSGTTLV